MMLLFQTKRVSYQVLIASQCFKSHNLPTYNRYWRRFRTVVFWVGMLCSAQALSAPVHIAVDTGRSQEYGAGISVGNGTECYVVAPFHVVEFARSITITDRNGRSAKANRYQAPDGVDAILLKVEAGHPLDCPEDWSDGSTGETAMQEADFLMSKKVQQRGMQRRRFFLGGETSTTVSIQPFSTTKADRLIEGDSGSSLYAKNFLVGMIVSVDTKSGAGEALKQSQLHALFGNLVVAQTAKLALVNPVYYQNREDRYATVGAKNFIDERTPFDAMELNSADAALNVRNKQQNIPPVYPEKIDYIISSTIVENRSRNENNPSYKASTTSTKSFGKQLLNSLGNRGVRYIYVSNIDVEIQISLPKEGRQFTNIERLEYRVPLTDKVDLRELETQLPSKAVVDALHATMSKYGLPVAPVAPEDKKANTNVLGQLLKYNVKD
ncbi:MAG: hypothetical protein GXP15_12380 [Gammaproteobacteria bacterium]|nr:hypothetical protein [Gammaproteobacteria bacterium]